jgi:hypothetical protein
VTFLLLLLNEQQRPCPKNNRVAPVLCVRVRVSYLLAPVSSIAARRAVRCRSVLDDGGGPRSAGWRGGSFTGETLDSGSGPCDAFRVVHDVLSRFARDMDHCNRHASEGRNPSHKVWRLEMLEDLFPLCETQRISYRK